MKDFQSFLETTHVPWCCASGVSWGWWRRNRSRDLWFRFIERRSIKDTIVIKGLGVGPSECKLSSLDVFETQDLPVQEGTESFRTITLIDSLSSRLLGELEHLIGQLVDAFVDRLHASIHDVDSVIVGMLDEFFHVTSKTREIGSD